MDFDKTYKQNNFTFKPVFVIIFLACISIVMFLLVSQYYLNILFERVEKQYRQGIINVVSVARNSIEPVLKKARLGAISRDEAIRNIQSIIKNMSYVDQSGNNYIFMISYDGLMLAQPSNPDEEWTNAIKLGDQIRADIFYKLLKAAKAYPDGSFVRYGYYHFPNGHDLQDKLSYVMGLPEVECLIGTGMYMNRMIQEQREITSKLIFISIGVLILVLVPALFSVLIILNSNKQLIREISMRNKIEKDLRISEERYRSIFENAVEGIFQTTPDGRLISANPAFARMGGYDSPQEMIAAVPHVEAHYANSSIRDKWIAELYKNGSVKNYRLKLKRKDGSFAWTSSNTRVVKDHYGNICYFEGTIEDITDRINAEEEREHLHSQLLQSQKLEAVGVLAGGVAHDFNNMLGAIIGYAELSLSQIDSTDPNYENIFKILEAAQRSAGLTRQLLAFARKQTISPVVLDINQSIEAMLSMLRRIIGENIILDWFPGEGKYTVKMDPAQLDQILANLCVNAKDAISGLGKIVIETSLVTFDEEYCKFNVAIIPGDYILITVSDNGSGMDQKTIEHIFEPFFTTKGQGKGTGLGLATIYGIVKQNKGFVNLYSEPGVGTTFKIFIPFFRAEVVEAIKSNTDEIPRSCGETILVIEDDPLLLKMSTKMLKNLGYEVLPAATPGEALRIASEENTRIDLFITDMVMPEMSGKDLSERLLKIRPMIKHIFMSGYTDDSITQHGILDRDVNFVQKPFSIKGLATKIREVLG